MKEIGLWDKWCPLNNLDRANLHAASQDDDDDEDEDDNDQDDEDNENDDDEDDTNFDVNEGPANPGTMKQQESIKGTPVLVDEHRKTIKKSYASDDRRCFAYSSYHGSVYCKPGRKSSYGRKSVPGAGPTRHVTVTGTSTVPGLLCKEDGTKMASVVLDSESATNERGSTGQGK